jgi:hypothetical protein
MSATATIVPTYYRVVYSGTTPTNWNTSTGTSASGGLDNTHAERYNRRIRFSGTQANPTVTAGHSIRLNDVEVVFSSTTLASVISDINALSQQHRVFAYEEVATYLTLANAPGREGTPMWVAGGTGTGLSDLGLVANVYREWPTALGSSAPVLPAAGDSLKVNGVTVTISDPGAGPTLTSVISDINSATADSQVIAFASADRIQLASQVQQPFALADVTVGIVADLGFAVGGISGGGPTTLVQSLDKERATMRWKSVVDKLGLLISPIFLGEIAKTGNQLGTAPVTTMSWTVGYDRANYLEIEDSLNPGIVLKGAACVKRLVALALHANTRGNQEIFDPALAVSGDLVTRLNPTQIVDVNCSQLNASLSTIEGNLSVTLIANV